MKKFLILTLPLLLLIPAVCQAQYKIVLKNTGKVIDGRFVKQDQDRIYIESNGIAMDFSKQMLDLDRMKLLNPSDNDKSDDKQAAGELNAIKARIAELTAAITERQQAIDSYNGQLADIEKANDASTTREEVERMLQAAQTEQQQFQSELADLEKKQSEEPPAQQ